MNITLSIDENIAQEARKIATGMGTSLNQLIRNYLELGILHISKK
jgi:antitoxin component of RelBE/YafQ-DinJ toxin-antitoxin module